MRRTIPMPMLVAVLVAGGCGGSATHTTASHAPTTTTSGGRPNMPAALERAVRRAVSEDHALLTHALLTNSVPAHAEGTGGPALADLRRSAAQRRAQHVTVRIISEDFRVLSVELDPSYTTATATVLNTQRVQPIYGGRPGARSTSREHVRLELRRIGDTERFVVWKVALLR